MRKIIKMLLLTSVFVIALSFFSKGFLGNKQVLASPSPTCVPNSGQYSCSGSWTTCSQKNCGDGYTTVDFCNCAGKICNPDGQACGGGTGDVNPQLTPGMGGGPCSANGDWGRCGSNNCNLDSKSYCNGTTWECRWDPGNCNIGGGFDCTQCGNKIADSPAKGSNWDGQNGATCYRPENNGAACCSCVDGNNECHGYWDCQNGNTYAFECTQRAPGQVCGPAEVPTSTPVPTGIPTATPVISPTPTPTSTVPSPTINPACTCDTGDVCNTACTFDKFTDVNYTSPLKCYLSSSLFPTPPTSKNTWCQRGLRTKGDADGSGVVNNTDYFYYVAAVNGGQIPANVNPDFNGDGEVGATDRTIVTKSLNP